MVKQHGVDHGTLPGAPAEKVPGKNAVPDQQELGQRKVPVMLQFFSRSSRAAPTAAAWRPSASASREMTAPGP